MLKILVFIPSMASMFTPVQSLDSRIADGLMKLDPDTRLEQRCNVELLDRIAKDDKRFRPDMAVAYALDTPRMQGDEIASNGGAFRSKGEWYRVAFQCRTAPDRMQVLSLSYQIGDKIPDDQWERYNLYR